MCNVQFREGFALTRHMAQPTVNVPKAHIIAAGCIISEAASFARRANIISNGVWGAAPPLIAHCKLLIVN